MKLFGQVLFASMLCLLSFGTSVRASDHIKDNLGLFSEKAIQQANQQIDQLYKNHGWMIAVETRDAAKIPNLPKDANDQDKFLTSWTTKQYESNQLQGIYLVIFKNPNKIRMHIDTDQERKMGVTAADTKAWISGLGKQLKGEADLALLKSVGDMSAKLSETKAPKKATAVSPAPNHSEPRDVRGHGHEADGNAAAGGSSMMTWLLVAGGVFIIFMIIRSVLRGMNQGNAGYGSPNQYGPGNSANMGGPNMGQPGYGGGYGAPSRGGGFMTGMLGGLFGGMAGNWMYDKMRGDHSSSESGQGHFTSHDSRGDDSGSYVDQSSNSSESDSTTYGGDWGSDSSADSGGGGGDWGDSGGGDFGGDGGGGGDW